MRNQGKQHMSEALIEQTCVLGSVEMDLLSRAMKKLSIGSSLWKNLGYSDNCRFE